MKKIFLTLLILTSQFFAQNTKDDCLACHSDATLSNTKNGKAVSLFVESGRYAASVHGSVECVDCHTGFNAENLPHKAGANISQVNCGGCHDTKVFKSSIHGVRNVDCYACHTKHAILPASSMTNGRVEMCMSCHNTGSVRQFTSGGHFKAYKNGNKVNCVTCHGNTAHDIKKTAFNKFTESQLCNKCHVVHKTPFSQGLHAQANQAEFPKCTSCHGQHLATVSRFSKNSQECLNCHLNATIFHPKDNEKLVNFIKTYQTSVHASIQASGVEAASCADCHGNHTADGIQSSIDRVKRENINATCGRCHQKQLTEFNASSHGLAARKYKDVAPVCTDCHGEHQISSVKGPEFTKMKIKEMCMNCHVKNAKVLALTHTTQEDIRHYERSAHWKALKAGNEKAAVCSDCHTGHAMLPAVDPNSSINKHNISKTCGKSGCHSIQKNDYLVSGHYKSLKDGKNDAPGCADCHGNHQIESPDRFSTTGEKSQFIAKLCSDCHASVKLSTKYGFSEFQTNSYFKSYHGLAVQGGSKYAANCSSCHNYHDVRPSSDPLSSINRANLSKTCGKCHPNAKIDDAFTKVHVTNSEDESILLYLVKTFYIWMIILTIGTMFIHNVLDLIRKRKEKKKHKHLIAELKKEGKFYVRMTKNERFQHFFLLTSFIGFVISGFALVYPEAFWVRGFRFILGDSAFELRSILHRTLGIIMIITSSYHIYYLAFTKSGRQFFKDFLPAWHDWDDIKVNMKYLTFRSEEKPAFRRFSYMEKAEYWALIWGTVVMSATGLLLMFNNFFLAEAPKIWFDVSTLIHYYEAWLATLSIIVWHFYFVIFSPEVYPINKAFLTGMMSEELMEAEHPLELERLKKEEEKSDEC
jgi:predicted CXXCH cytochrome family protein